MLQQIALTDQPAKPAGQPKFFFQNYQKAGLLVLVAGILYIRLALRKRKKDKICPHCSHRNPYHRSNCTKCSAPLFMAKHP
jgi:ribosomal protein S27AE